MDVETKNASLDTLAITILALHVNGKQMTLAVFRQLPEGREDEDSELWGTVRYTIKDAGDLWLVFSSKGILFRRAIDTRSRRIYRHDLDSDIAELERTTKTIEALRRQIDDGVSYSWSKSQIEEKEKYHAALKGAVEQGLAEYHEECKYEKDRLEYENRMSKLRQLFIAV